MEISKDKKKIAKRKYIRYQPQEDMYAQIQLSKKSKTFRPSLFGIVLTEGFGGCGIVAPNNSPVQKGDVVTVKAGKLDPLEGKVVWIEELDQQVIKFGVKFLE